ncbi:hypothetical protein HGP17_31830 [Rhizobium sp. P38BS-XIX]|uniref:hypothetical protein n=1 Tax=Rhizobium sp. P38BS-XIX TaxID=2726740 RepID=UPI001456C28E|nr:hypothetical protein [Rhizobium sp. P38BS-XIX]NLS01447.1 hypothetical protein [Rhizobium sp. P38BS-XIX]
MLLPVGAVSVVGVSVEKPVVATPETSGLQTAATPVAVLSNAINTGVEGKLNMLLVAARERMFDSLLSAIDAASAALGVARKPDESNASFAQRVVAAIRSLPPEQLAAAQQRLDAQMSPSVPLPLLAEVLEEPESPQAVQLALNLEQASAAEPDAVLKAVVNSYGQNAGETGPIAGQSLAAPLQKAIDATSTPMAGLAPPSEETAMSAANLAAASPISKETQQLGTAPQAAPAATAETPTAIAPQNATAPVTTQAAQTAVQVVPTLEAPVPAIAQFGSSSMPQATAASGGAAAAQTTQPLQLAALVDDLAASALIAAIAAEAEIPTEVAMIRSPLTPPSVPRDIQQIQADLKQGLQVVIGPPAMAASADLLQIIKNPSSSVEKIIAQALTGNAAAEQPSSQQPINDHGRASAMIVPASLADQQETPAAMLSGKAPLPVSSVMSAPVYEAAEQAAMSAPLPPGVPFVVANYLPAETPVKNRESKLLNRVDPVGDEDGGQTPDEDMPQDRHHDDEEAGSDAQSVQTAEGQAGVVEEAAVPSPNDRSRPDLAALPQPLRDPLQDHAFDFYRRMVAWE